MSRFPLTSRLVPTLLVLTALIVAGPACKKKQPEATPPPPQPAVEAPPPPPPPKEVKPDFPPEPPKPIVEPNPTSAELNTQGVLKTVYFEYDKSDLTDAARRTLQANVTWLRSNPWHPAVLIEGHCDERGTIEYNLALGQRRANAVRDYLTGAGIDGSKLRVTSWGEERPAVQGTGDAVWKLNRRAEFRFQ